jgi:hypothetical protein
MMERIITLQAEIAILNPPTTMQVFENSGYKSDPSKILFTGDLNEYDSLVNKEQRDLDKNLGDSTKFSYKFLWQMRNLFYKINYYKVTVGILSKESHELQNVNPMKWIEGKLQFDGYNIIQYHDMILNTFEREIRILPYDLMEKFCEPTEDFFTFHWLMKKEMLKKYNEKVQELETLRVAYMFSQCVIETKMHQKIPVKEQPPVIEISRYKTCIVCEENDANICFISCGHILTCKNCSKGIEQCPMCKKDVLSVLKIYL